MEVFLNIAVTTTESMESTSTNIQKLWNDLSSENQAELLQKLIEAKKNHTSPLSPNQDSRQSSAKRVLQSPDTPFKGRSRKVIRPK